MRRPTLNLVLIFGLLAALLAGVGLSHWMNPSRSLEGAGLVLETSRSIPDFALLTQHGAPYTPASVKGRWQLLFFGFTHCPDICPSTLAKMRQLRADLPPEQRGQIDFVMVSVDPERDTAAVLKPYLAHFDPTFVGVTGELAAIEAFAASLGIAFIKVTEGDSYTMDHSTAMVLLTPQSQVKAYFSAPHELPAMQATLSQLLP